MAETNKKMSLLTTEEAPLSILESLKETYENAKPFPHIVLNSSETPFPLDLEFLRTLRTSLQKNTPVTYKETDLFKLYQTKDLSDSKDPAISALASTLYTDSFRSYVSKLTSCPELTSRVDMAASAYASGCHLLCHDDVIGTRAVSFVLYLSDEDWDGKTDGGNLELYSSPHEPVPAKLVPPTFGTLVLFEVKPGVSFHAVQEVFRVKSPRLSVQGWFHASHPPKGVNSTSTLSDLTRRTNEEGFDSLPSKITSKIDDDAYLTRLSKYINKVYLKPSSVKQIQEEFETNSTVHLYDFFNPSFISIPNDEEKNYETTGPVHMRRYRRLKKERENAMLKLFQSDPDFVRVVFKRWND